jgi:hypothetical protein
MWAPWAVAFTIGFLAKLASGDTGLAIAFGVLLVLDLVGAVMLRRTRGNLRTTTIE